MITRISLEKIGSYNNLVEINDLSKVNFFFGSNGSGKSTIAKAVNNFKLKNTELDEYYKFCSIDGYDERNEKILVFDEKFVEKNFIINSDLSGVFTLNEGNEEIDELIRVEKDKLAKSEKYKDLLIKREAQIKKSLEKQRSALKDACWDERASFSAFFELDLSHSRNKENHLNEVVENVSSIPERYNVTLESLHNRYKDLYETSLSKIETKISEDIFNELVELEDKICLLMEEVIDTNKDIDIADLIEKLEIRKWVSEGRSYTVENKENICPFCQHETYDEELKTKFEEYFNENYIRKIEELESYKILCSELLNNFLDSIFEVSKVYNKQNKTSELHKELTDLLRDNTEIFDKKIKNSNEKFEFFSVYDFENSVNQINFNIESNNDKIEELQSNRTKLIEDVWIFMASKCKDEITEFKLYEKKATKLILRCKESQNELLTCQQGFRNEIQELKLKTVSTDDAIKNINTILKNSGFDSFEIAEKTTSNNISRYYLKRGQDSNAIFKTLSEGEKNFIAFLYFHQLVLGTDSQEENVGKRIVIIDDPVSSLDSKVLFIVSTLIHNLIEYSQADKNNFKNGDISQVFILTHNIYFYKEVSLSRRPICKQRKHYYVHRHNKSSVVEDKGKETFIANDYTLLWKTIKDIKRNPDNTYNITLCNNMRRILESYVNFLGIGRTDWDSLQNIDVNDPNYYICSALISELNDSSHKVSIFDDVYYHRILNIEPAEIFNAFEIVFTSIGEKHYTMMMGE